MDRRMKKRKAIDVALIILTITLLRIYYFKGGEALEPRYLL